MAFIKKPTEEELEYLDFQAFYRFWRPLRAPELSDIEISLIKKGWCYLVKNKHGVHYLCLTPSAQPAVDARNMADKEIIKQAELLTRVEDLKP